MFLLTSLLATALVIENSLLFSPISKHQDKRSHQGLEIEYLLEMQKSSFSVFLDAQYRQYHNLSFSSSVGMGIQSTRKTLSPSLYFFYDTSTLSSVFMQQASIGVAASFRYFDLQLDSYLPWNRHRAKKGYKIDAYSHTDLTCVYKNPLFHVGVSPYLIHKEKGLRLYASTFYKNFSLVGTWQFDKLTANSFQLSLRWNFLGKKKTFYRNSDILFKRRKITIPPAPLLPLPFPEEKQEALEEVPLVPLPLVEEPLQPTEDPPAPVVKQESWWDYLFSFISSPASEPPYCSPDSTSYEFPVIEDHAHAEPPARISPPPSPPPGFVPEGNLNQDADSDSSSSPGLSAIGDSPGNSSFAGPSPPVNNVKQLPADYDSKEFEFLGPGYHSRMPSEVYSPPCSPISEEEKEHKPFAFDSLELKTFSPSPHLSDMTEFSSPPEDQSPPFSPNDYDDMPEAEVMVVLDDPPPPSL